ncbi:hypothetical protein H2200_013606 [Cladophialophora chaetospira]|uniref:Uncharacterized protein n=1 Tax=Cladophialophora chaetospira TaxID=386627 RepID=A0AA38U7H3_9EURO|nr:hypothetical protein H2200_013606 [Cladophialophora chaetospira]
MEDSNETEASYSPSLWVMQDSIVQAHDSPFDGQQIWSPFAGTPLNTVDLQDAPEAANEQQRTRKRQRTLRNKLPLLQLEEWERERVYNEEPPICVHYAVDWKICLDDKQISKNSERNVVLEPASFWQAILRPRLEGMVEKKMGHVQNAQPYETIIVTSVTARGEHDLTHEFEGLGIDWTDVNSQLIDWSNLFQDGKKLRIDLTFYYRSQGPSPSGPSVARRGGRGRLSVTQQRIQERSARLQAEEETEGRASTWAEVYQKVRCPSACPKGPHCFIDEEDPERTHYKLYTLHLRRLVKHKLEGGKFDSQGDIPDDLRRDLYAEADRANARKRTARRTSPAGPVPVTINNNFPEQSSVGPLSATKVSADGRGSADLLSPVIVSGHHDVAVHNYSTWLQSRYDGTIYKEAIVAAEQLVQNRMLGLDHLHEDRNWQFLVNEGIPVGIARRFVCDIKLYFKHLHTE